MAVYFGEKKVDFSGGQITVIDGTDTTDATATTSDILSGKTAYVNDEKVIGTIPTIAQATPTISVDDAGLVTASSIQNISGYMESGTKTATYQIPSFVSLPDVIEAGDYPIYGITTNSKITSSSYTDLGIYIFTVKRAGTYRFKWAMMRSPLSLGLSEDITGSALYKKSSGDSYSLIYSNEEFEKEEVNILGTVTNRATANMQYNVVDVTCQEGDVISIRGKYTGSIYAGYLFGVNVCIKWDNPNAFFV